MKDEEFNDLLFLAEITVISLWDNLYDDHWDSV